jgi:hypothetical protein
MGVNDRLKRLETEAEIVLRRGPLTARDLSDAEIERRLWDAGALPLDRRLASLTEQELQAMAAEWEGK